MFERPESFQPIPSHAKKVFKGIVFDVYHWEQELFDGSRATFEKIKRTDTVFLIPITEDGNILITKQEQPGMQSSFLSLPGGKINPGESVEEAAKRELLEESGCQAKELILWEAFHAAKDIDWVIYFIIAKGCRKVEDVKPDAGERIEVEELSFDEFVETVASGAVKAKDLRIKILEAKLDPEKMNDLHTLFLG